mgnify:FL=1
MPDTRIPLFLLAGLLTQSACPAADIETVILQINPFVRPVLEAVTHDSDRKMASKTADEGMRLRGTMLAGSNSVANIDGTIIGIGQQVNGYTLVSVEQRHVLLYRNGTQMILSIDSETDGND